MALKSDAQGFLVGDPIALNSALKDWAAIREDVRAIRHALTAGAPTVPKSSERGHKFPAIAAQPATPQTGGKGASLRNPQTAVVAGQAVAAIRAASAATRRAPAVPTTRDMRGRFLPRDKAQGAPGGLADTHTDSPALRGMANRIVGAIQNSGAGAEEADPAIKAFNEVARPMARGYELLAGGDKQKRQEGWLRRIWTSLAGFRKEESLFNKETNKRLKSLDEKQQLGKKSGGLLGDLLGALGGMLTRIPGLGGLMKTGGAVLGGAGKAVMGAGRGLLGLGKGALKRIPFLGSLLAVGGAASDIFDTENDNTLTRREKDQHDGKAVGGAAGSIGGMLAGAKLGAMVGALGGPIGAAIGGVVGGAAGMFFGDQAGQILGETVGGWVNDLRSADIPGMISSAWQAPTSAIMSGWDATTKFLQDGWNSATDVLKKGWDTAKGATKAAGQWVADKANAANDFIKDKTGVGIKAGAVAVKDKAVELGGKAVDATKAGAVALKDKAVDAGSGAIDWAAKNTTVGKAASKAWDGAKAAGNWVLGQTSKLFESGKGGAGTVSSGKGDLGGASYGTYQLSSSQGTLQQFLKASKYGEQFAGLQPGTPEFNAKWKEVAKADPEFGNAQHDFIKQTHFDPQMAKLAKGGIDLSGRGAAVQDAVWSTSVQFGGRSSLIEKALAGKDVSKLSDAEVVAAIQDYKVANNDKLFANSSAGVRAGTANRAAAEKEQLLALANAPQNVATADVATPAMPQMPAPVSYAAPKMPAVSASASAPSVPSAPSMPSVPEAPPVTVPLASGGSDRPIQVSMPTPDAGQDIRDRQLAHIVTGGFSA